MNQSQHTGEAVGSVIGATLGFLKSVSIFSLVSWAVVLDTAILSAVGAVVGLVTTVLVKVLAKKFFKTKD